MTTRQFRRLARLPGPQLTDGDVHLEPPPELARPLPRNVLMTLMPVVMIGGMVGFIVISGGGTSSMLMGGMMAMSMIGMLMNGTGRQGKSPAAVDEERKDYLRYLPPCAASSAPPLRPNAPPSCGRTRTRKR